MGYDVDNRIETLPLLGADDDSSHALELLMGAWAQGDAVGVAHEQMAYAALFTAMSSLVSYHGEDAVARMARGLERRVQVGEFSKHGTRQ